MLRPFENIGIYSKRGNIEINTKKSQSLEAFVNASEAVNFIIRLSSSSDFGPFELTNNWTRERLTLRHFNKDNWLLVRCPIRREEDKWAKWEKEAIEWQWRRQWNRIAITFDDKDIGNW
uniref:Uncharacterized protein n=1 Tax=Globodera pallida TaxID=36090 RepID=A0A183C676_GLOPA